MPTKTNEISMCRDLATGNFSAVNCEMLFEPHMHNYYEIVITLESNFSHTINSRVITPKFGDTVIIRPGDTHSAVPTAVDNHRARDIYVTSQMFINACNILDSQLFKQICAMPEPPSFSVTEEYIEELERRISFPFFAEALTPKEEGRRYVEMIKKSIVAEILGQYVYSTFIEKRALPDCLINLTLNLNNPKYKDSNIVDIAEDMGYSHTYLCHRFSEYFGKTMQQYILEEKLDRTLPLLLRTDLSVKQIAMQVGWKRVDNFIKAFKKVYGTTPGQYRIAMRKKKQ